MMFATDLCDEGFDRVLDNAEHRAGVRGITLALVYHDGRDIFPHNPARKVRFHEAGALFFRPDPALYEKLRIRPFTSKLAHEMDVVSRLHALTELRGLKLYAWVVFLHSDRLGALYPDCASRNAFGDPYLTDLCPANPDVRAYVRALSADIARRGVAAILAESLHYHPLEHGYHHERYLIDLGARSRYLLGLCFCDHCLRAARRHGVDAAGVRAVVRADLEHAFAGSDEEEEGETEGEMSYAGIAALAEGEMAGYLEARAETVRTLALEAAEAASANGPARFTFIDPSGAVKGHATGKPSWVTAPSLAWRFGLELSSLVKVCDELEAAGYATDPECVRDDVEAYREFDAKSLALALRPLPPDCKSSENLIEKVRIARSLGVARVDFYHYGFMRLGTLDWIRQALEDS